MLSQTDWRVCLPGGGGVGDVCGQDYSCKWLLAALAALPVWGRTLRMAVPNSSLGRTPPWAACRAVKRTQVLFPFYFQWIKLFFFFFGQAGGMQRFPGQGSNPCHSHGLSHSSDNTRSLTTRSPGNSQLFFSVQFFFLSLLSRSSSPPWRENGKKGGGCQVFLSQSRNKTPFEMHLHKQIRYCSLSVFTEEDDSSYGPTVKS